MSSSAQAFDEVGRRQTQVAPCLTLGGQPGLCRFGLLALTRRADASRLLAARRTIIAELDRAKTDYLAATRGSTY